MGKIPTRSASDTWGSSLVSNCRNLLEKPCFKEKKIKPIWHFFDWEAGFIVSDDLGLSSLSEDGIVDDFENKIEFLEHKRFFRLERRRLGFIHLEPIGFGSEMNLVDSTSNNYNNNICSQKLRLSYNFYFCLVRLEMIYLVFGQKMLKKIISIVHMLHHQQLLLVMIMELLIYLNFRVQKLE